MASLLGIVATPVAGWLSDRIGVRPVGAFGLVALMVAMAGLSLLNGDIRIFYAWLGAIQFFGAASSSIVFSRPIAQAFSKFRGAALGLGLGLSGVIVMIVSPILQIVIAYQSWRAGYLFLAGLAGVVGLSAAIFLVPSGTTSQNALLAEDRRGSLTFALSDRRFWLMFFAMLSANLCFGGLLGQLPALLADHGLAPLSIGLAMSMLGGAAIVGRILNGLALDRLWAPGVACASLVFPIVGLLLLTTHVTLRVAMVAIFLIGSAMGAESTILSFFTARFFGLRAYGAIYGALAIAISISLASGGAMFGLVYDRTGSYNAALIVAALGMGLAAACLLLTGVGQQAREQAPLGTDPLNSKL
jgi:predicted MFS family arabinose efflux permease